jgi:hypothetical protein
VFKEVELKGDCALFPLPQPPEDLEWFGDILIMSLVNTLNIMINMKDDDSG